MRVLLPALAALLAAVCAPRVEPVAVEFRNLELERFERGEVELAIFNPNRVAVDVEALRYSLLLGTDTVALGRRDAPVPVPARDSTLATFPVEIRFSFDRVFGRLEGFLDDTLRLTVDGRYTVRGAFGPRRRPFRYRHELPLRTEVERLLDPLRSLYRRWAK